MSACSPPVTFALVGYGEGGRYFHAPVIAGAAGARLGFIVTGSPERSAQAAAEHPQAEVVPSLAEAVAAGAQAVAISTPVATHSQLTDQAIALGVPTVCDKPFALDARAARASVQRARSTGVLLSPCQNRRWDSDFRTLRRVLANGELGQVTRLESALERWAPAEPVIAGGGLLRDFGTHLVDQALVLFGPVESVAAQTSGGDGCEREARLQLQHVNGVVSELSASLVQPAPAPRYRLTGTAGSFVLEAPLDVQEALLLAGRTPGVEGDAWGVEPPSRWGAVVLGDGPARRVPSEPGRWPDFYAAFARAVRGRGPVPVDPADAIATCEILDAARRAARSGATVRLPTHA
nr:Gfo/Idh/MocA family oxidoreductase [Kineococcus aurantiacus]